jgi:hypothetical protein
LRAALGPIGFTVSGHRSDEVMGFGDLDPMFSLRWNAGVQNLMTYVTSNVPIGMYDQRRLANLGLGYNAVDAGVGYTYLNPQSGIEYSGTLGFTYNLRTSIPIIRAAL